MNRQQFTWLTAIAVVLGAAAFGSADDTTPDKGKLFGKLDKNGDGTLTSDEIDEKSKKHFDRLIRIGDANGDGQLTQKEFTRAQNKKNPKVEAQGRDGRGPKGGKRFDPKKRFEMLDRNGDGKLTKDELDERPERFVKALFGGEGDEQESLSKDEFVERLGKLRERFAGRKKGRQADGRPGAQGRRGKPGGGPGDAGDRRRPGGRPDFGEGGPRHVPVIFRVLDANDDGKISKQELAKAADKFDKLDENDDGSLDPRELLGPPPHGRRGEGPPRQFGKKGEGPARRPDGAKGKAGRQGGPKRKAGGAGKNVEKRFKKLDSDSDGKISKSEAPKKLKKRFDKLDANADGAVDLEEFKKAASRRGKAGKPGGKGKGGKGKGGKRKKPAADDTTT